METMEARSKLSLDTYYISNLQTLVQRVSFSQRGPIRYIVRFLLSLKYIITNGFVHLSVVDWALKENGIRCLRIDQKSKNESAANLFRTNPDILVLLLHGCVFIVSCHISHLQATSKLSM